MTAPESAPATEAHSDRRSPAPQVGEPWRSKKHASESWPSDYLEINRAAYNALAKEYRARREPDRQKDIKLIQPFLRLLRKQYGNGPLRVLDLGCGNGLNLSMFADEGFEVTGIDISGHMLEVARESCPSAHLIGGDFLSYPFPQTCFHGVFAKAVIHLFPKPHAIQLIDKVRYVLKPGGIFYVTTTVDDPVTVGLRKKTDYKGSVYRFRRTWTTQELTESVSHAGFAILKTSYNREVSRGKRWFNIWARNLL